MNEQSPDDESAMQQIARASRRMDDLMDTAVTRYLEATNFNFRDYLTPDELDEYDEADITMREVGRVVIELAGGVAQVTRNPLDIEVEIIHHDDLSNGAEQKGQQ